MKRMDLFSHLSNQLKAAEEEEKAAANKVKQLRSGLTAIKELGLAKTLVEVKRHYKYSKKSLDNMRGAAAHAREIKAQKLEKRKKLSKAAKRFWAARKKKLREAA